MDFQCPFALDAVRCVAAKRRIAPHVDAFTPNALPYALRCIAVQCRAVRRRPPYSNASGVNEPIVTAFFTVFFHLDLHCHNVVSGLTTLVRDTRCVLFLDTACACTKTRRVLCTRGRENLGTLKVVVTVLLSCLNRHSYPNFLSPSEFRALNWATEHLKLYFG